MSRIGLKPIPVPKNVKVDVRGSHVSVEGPKGTLDRSFHPDMEIVPWDFYFPLVVLLFCHMSLLPSHCR